MHSLSCACVSLGKRYDDHSIPLEFLRDVAVLEEMVVEVAKSKFLADHPNRQRSPRGFTRNIHLMLAAIDPGSATLDIRLAPGTTDLAPDSQPKLFRIRARCDHRSY